MAGNIVFRRRSGRMETGRHSCHRSLTLQLLKSALLVEETQTLEKAEKRAPLGKSFQESWRDGFRTYRRYSHDCVVRHRHILPEEQAEPGICLLSTLSAIVTPSPCSAHPHSPCPHLCSRTLLAHSLPCSSFYLLFTVNLLHWCLHPFFISAGIYSWCSVPFGYCLVYLSTLCMFQA